MEPQTTMQFSRSARRASRSTLELSDGQSPREGISPSSSPGSQARSLGDPHRHCIGPP